MTTLLKDMPEHAERIENNYSLIGKIKDEIHETVMFGRTGSNEDDIEIANPNAIAENLLGVFADFVNQNYTWKGSSK